MEEDASIRGERESGGTLKEGTEVGLLIQGPLFFPTIILNMFSESHFCFFCCCFSIKWGLVEIPMERIK